jgi:Eukaryotic aspartyl protease
LWVPASNATACAKGCPGGSFDASKSSTFTITTPGAFNITYGDLTSDAGDYFTDVVGIGGVEVQNFTMGLATTTLDGNIPNTGQGLMGVGYELNEAATAHLGAEADTPTIYQQLVTTGTINRPAFSLYLNDEESGTGSILFGGIDSTKYTGDLVGLPVQLGASGNYTDYLVALTAISINDDSGTRRLTDPNFGIPCLIDSGSTSQTLPGPVADALMAGFGALQGAVPCAYRNSNASLTYQFGGASGLNINVPLAALVASVVGATFEGIDLCGLGVGNGGDAQVILGDSFMRSAYVVYDPTNNFMAMAQAVLNATSTSNIMVIPTGADLPGVSSTASLLLGSDVLAQTGAPAPSTAVTATPTALPSPTFALGSATMVTLNPSATGGGAAASSSGGGGSTSAAVHPMAVGSGVWVFGLALATASLFGALL